MLQKFSFKFFFLNLILISSLYALEVPRLTGPVIDQAKILTSNNKSKIETALRNLNRSENIQIQVLILNSLEGDSLEEFSIRAVEKWKLGGEKSDRGALLLVAINDRKMRIEVGDGLEGQLTDLTAGRIIDSMKPFFKNSDFDTGIYVGVASIAQAAGVDLGDVKLARSTRGRRKNKTSALINLIFLILFIILTVFRRRSGILFMGGGGGFSSGGGSFGGGGGWSGGGGSFSGGGSSGSW
ncbi:MAG: hypothetical protein ACJAT2_000424 [Bacteriovoracaceae bacterium]|jgi:uncharacterized protein